MLPWFIAGLLAIIALGLAVTDSSRSAEAVKLPIKPTRLSPQDEKWVRLALELKRQHMDRFFERRRVEWRVSITLWGGVAVAANALRGLPVEGASRAGVIAAGLVILGLHIYWARAFNDRGAQPNREIGNLLEDEIRNYLGVPIHPHLPYRAFVAHYWQVVVTAILLLGAYHVMVGG